MGRTARILTWSAGIFVGLDRRRGRGGLPVRDLGRLPQPGRKRRERLLRPQDAYRQDFDRLGLDRARSPGRRRGGQRRVGQGRPHAEGRAGRFRHQAVAAAQGRLRPAEPRAAQARGRRRGGRQGAVELEPRRKPGDDRRRQGGSAQGTLPDAADRAARDHRRAPLLPGHQAQALARRHGLDGGGQGRRPAAGRAAAQGQAREPAAHASTSSAARPSCCATPSSPIRSISMSTTAPRNSP